MTDACDRVCLRLLLGCGLLLASSPLLSAAQQGAGTQQPPVATATAPASGQGSGQGSGQAAAGTGKSPVQSGATDAAKGKSSADEAKTAKDGAEKKPANPDGIAPGVPQEDHQLRNERKAAKLYLQGVKLLASHRSEAAMTVLQRAAELDRTSVPYQRAAALARESLITQLDDDANRAAARGDKSLAAELLQRAYHLDPENDLTVRNIRLLTGKAAVSLGTDEENEKAEIAANAPELKPSGSLRNFHLNMPAPELIRQVFAAYGITAEIHSSVEPKMARLELDHADFTQAAHALGLVTNTFYVPLDGYRVLVARETKENHLDLDRQQMETVYMPGLTAKELTDVSNLAHNVFGMKQAIAQPSAETVTVRAPMQTLQAFNTTVQQLEDGRNQIDLDVKIIELAHVSMRETGATFLQQTGVYNAYSEVQSILSQNQAAVQQILSSGIISNANSLANQIAIVAILAASGALTGTPFNQGFIPFGKGLTQSLITPGAATLTLSLNSSDTRTLNDVHLRLGDDEEGTIKDGERYPIETASYSSATLSPALSAAATQAGYGALAQQQNVPQIQYEDLGLTLRARPRQMRSGDVAMTLSLKIEALQGASLNGIPVLDNRQFDGVLTLRAGETAVLFSDLSRQETRALNGLPGLGDIPGMQDINDIQVSQNTARLIVLVTPTVARSTQPKGHGPMLTVDKNSMQ